MEGLRAYRLLPVPMRLDDPRWRRSWRQKPCLVYHVSEGRVSSFRFGPLAFAACRSALKPLDQPEQVGRRRIVQNVGVDPHEVPRRSELQGG